jgi:hypothetical protein
VCYVLRWFATQNILRATSLFVEEKMARRTPGLQTRSQVHGYWGQFTYDTSVAPATHLGRTGDVGSTLLPNVSVALSAAEFAKLEAGDWASTIDAVAGSGIGFWTCIFPGTVGVGGAVWARTDNASLAVQTIRDAHRIVVGIIGTTTGVPATDTLLNLIPYTAGVSADFIDTGDGAALALALATAAVLGSVDVRVVSGLIDLGSGAVSTPLTVPANCRLIGAGSQQTEIVGKSTGEQGIFSLSNLATVEGFALTSPTAVASPGTALGVVQSAGLVSGTFSLRDLAITLSDDAALRVAKAGVYGSAAGSGGVRTCDLDRVRVTVTNPVANTAGIALIGYARPSISNCVVTGATKGLEYQASATLLGGTDGVSIANFKGYDLGEIGINVECPLGGAILGMSISDCYLKFADADAGPQDQIALLLNTSGAFDQINISGVQANWSNNALSATRQFARVATAAGASARGLSFQGCGATSNPAFSSSLTQGLVLDATDANSIIGSDLGCDFGGAGPLAAGDIINVPTATVLWEHAHFRGLA